MEALWETFEKDAPGWKWIAVARDGPNWLAAMLFKGDSDAVEYSGILSNPESNEALNHGHIVYDDAVPVRKKIAKKDIPRGALLWLYSVEITKNDDKKFAEFEEELIHKLNSTVCGFAITKPFAGSKRLSFSAVFGSSKDLDAYRKGVLNPLLKGLPVKEVNYDDIAPICGYNDAEPDDGDCTIM